MMRDALKATPPALNAILGRYQDELKRGMLDLSRHEDEEVHFQLADGSKGLAAAGVEHKLEEIQNILRKRQSLRRFAYAMGALAHLVADVGFPLNASDADPREPLYREAYSRFIEASMDKIPFVLDRLEPSMLEAGDLRGFIMALARQSARGYELIGPAFNDDGTPSTREALDVRSIPFGIASLSYSRATTDIVRVWRYVWASVDGDFSGTPFMDPQADRQPASASVTDEPPSGP